MSTSFTVSDQTHFINFKILDTFITWVNINFTNKINLFILFQQTCTKRQLAHIYINAQTYSGITLLHTINEKKKSHEIFNRV